MSKIPRWSGKSLPPHERANMLYILKYRKIEQGGISAVSVLSVGTRCSRMYPD